MSHMGLSAVRAVPCNSDVSMPSEVEDVISPLVLFSVVTVASAGFGLLSFNAMLALL